MADTETVAKTERKNVAESLWYRADGQEADSPLDSVASVTFSLSSLPGKSWTLDMADARTAMEAAGLEPAYVNKITAYAGFGFKTKCTNDASQVRNNEKKKGTAEGSPEAQGEALDETAAEILAGNWRAARGEGENVPGVADLAQAILRWQTRNGKQNTLEAVTESVKKMDKDTRKRFRENNDIKIELGEIRLERLRKAAKKAEGSASDDDLMAA